MIKIEKTETYGWEAAIRGMRNAMNSWDRIDTAIYDRYQIEEYCNGWSNGLCPHNGDCLKGVWVNDFQSLQLGKNDLNLMTRLRKAGTDHRKYMRMIVVYCDITAPLYFWKQFDTYKVGTVVNSCSTMHKIQAKEFTLDDFSHEHLISSCLLEDTINELNIYRDIYNNYDRQTDEYKAEFSKKDIWWQMIQLLGDSYNQKRTVMLNYEVLANIYGSRLGHKLDEWNDFCEWIKTLPYSELITGCE